MTSNEIYELADELLAAWNDSEDAGVALAAKFKQITGTRVTSRLDAVMTLAEKGYTLSKCYQSIA